jgi:phosphoglycerol transferase MdoB-like AlkP superfamily enzyme
MKKILFVIGFISSVILTIGVTFKLLHIQGANALFMVGFLVLLLIFVPVLAFKKYKAAAHKKLYERLKIILGAASAIVVGIAGLLKLVHFMGAECIINDWRLSFYCWIPSLYFFTPCIKNQLADYS